MMLVDEQATQKKKAHFSGRRVGATTPGMPEITVPLGPARVSQIFAMKKRKHMVDPSNKKKGGRGRKGKKQSQVQESSIVDRVNEEIRQVVPPELFRGSIREPLPNLARTKSLDGYEEARFSAENALRKLYAATDAARAGFESESPILEVFFYKVRAGLIQSDSPEIVRWLKYALQIGKAIGSSNDYQRSLMTQGNESLVRRSLISSGHG